ncbi:uncharacterized protein METZ01_LOCUS440 [marine metagenome]|uniref:Ancillary SecYEG translocon subunit/Cell division coordinator CpoB TPR domain-containing protein n=1 Tax=marine metagenome TaxID=408172 RepID=A0A381MZ41_9ZZZZ
MAIVAVVGWNQYQSYTIARSESAAKAYESYSNARIAGQPVEDLLAEIDTEHSKTPYQIFSLLYRAKDSVVESDWGTALGHLDTAISLTNDPRLLDLIRMRKARIQFQLESFDESLATLGKIKGIGFKVGVSELTGDIHRMRNDNARAAEAYQAGITGANDSSAAIMLKLKLSSLGIDP